MISTTYNVTGVRSHNDVLEVRLAVSNVQHVGAVAMERRGDETRMIIKHKDDVEPDREALAAAVKEAGPFTLL